jgi:hypothetical protein
VGVPSATYEHVANYSLGSDWTTEWRANPKGAKGLLFGGLELGVIDTPDTEDTQGHLRHPHHGRMVADCRKDTTRRRWTAETWAAPSYFSCISLPCRRARFNSVRQVENKSRRISGHASWPVDQAATWFTLNLIATLQRLVPVVRRAANGVVDQSRNAHSQATSVRLHGQTSTD